MNYEKLFEPIKIGKVEIKNRIALAPMNTLFHLNNSGYPNEQEMAHYAARAKGGAGLIITGAVLGTRLAARFPAHSNLHLFDRAHIGGLAEVAETVHVFGAKVFVQLSIGFGRAGHSPHSHEAPPAPSAIPMVRRKGYAPKAYWEILRRDPEYSGGDVLYGQMPREMSIEEIQQEQQEFANSAKLAVHSGFDGLEIHAPHGYLEFQFLSPLSNRRTDLYGGSLENRMRFLVETVAKTVQATKSLSPSFAVGVRLSAQEHIPGGITYEETQMVVKKMAELGVDYIHLSDGSHEAFKWMFPEEDGTMLDEAAGFRKIVNIPMMTPSVHNPDTAEEAVREAKTDMISLGRALLADPEWPNKVKEGKVKEIRRCTRDNFCLLRFRGGLPLRCTQNPHLGREKYMSEYQRPIGLKGEELLPVVMRKKRD